MSSSHTDEITEASLKDRMMNNEPIQFSSPVSLINVKREVGEKVILDASVSFPRASITAVMGASGSGKTTMLNIIAGSIQASDGRVCRNCSSLGYVMQRDILVETDTVEESLTFVADVQLSRLPRELRRDIVDRVIDELGLGSIRHNLVGKVAENSRGVSGGEKKRVAIAQTLISNPDILLLDEPTSGLDSYAASNIVDTLSNLARSGKTVICTIHQPSSELFQKFDHLILVSCGRVVYSGRPMDSVKYFEDRGHLCPIYNNPPDFFIKTLMENEHLSGQLSRDWTANELFVDHQTPELPDDSPPPRPINLLLATHCKRFWRRSLRDPYTAKYRILQNFVISIIYGTFFWNLGNDKAGVDAKLGSMFYMVLYQGIIFSFMSAISSFPLEIGSVMREQLTYPYGLSQYTLSKSIMEFPLSFVCNLLFGTIANFMIGLNADFSRYVKFITINLLCAMVGQSWGYMITSTFQTLEVINAVTPIMIPFVIMGGYFTVDVPIGAVWMYNLSFVRWTFQAMAEVVFEGTILDCPQNVTNCYLTGAELLDDYRVESGIFWKSCLVLGSQFVILRVLIAAALWRRKKWCNNVQE